METYKLKACTSGQYLHYSYTSDLSKYDWAHVGPPTKSGIVHQLTTFTDCRESVCARIFDQLTPGSTKHKIKVDRLRLAVLREFRPQSAKVGARNFDLGMRAGLHIINTFESTYGWSNKRSNKTKLYNLVPINTLNEDGVEARVKMIDAHPNWVRSSHMLSLLMLIFRMAQARSFKTKSFMRLRSVGGIMKKVKAYARGKSNGDKYYVSRSMDYWVPIMENFDALFRGLPIRRNFHRKSLGRKKTTWAGDSPYYNGATEGIDALCHLTLKDQIIRKRFAKILKTKVTQ